MRKEELRSKQRLAAIASEAPGWVDFLCGVKKLQALDYDVDDPLLPGSAYELIAPYFNLDPKQPPPKNIHSAWTGPALAAALEGVKVTFWRSKPGRDGNRELLPGLYCPDLKTAAAARWLLEPDLRVCLYCGNVFVAERPKQTECHEAHTDAYRQARYRERERRKRQNKKEAV
jgi:hypothetical protein